MRIHTSNRLEVLADLLCQVVADPLPSPLEPETIVVRSRGMERWLSMRLAERHGVWANGRFPFPNLLLWDAFKAVLPDLPRTDPYDPEVLVWKVMKALPVQLERPGFEPLKQYLAQDEEGLKRFQLARRVANAFDQYTVFRPDLVTGWEQGLAQDEDAWQAELWRSLSRDGGPVHKAAIRHAFLAEAGDVGTDRYPLPRRLSIFGIPALPGLHLDVFQALSRQSDVHVFLVDPCREYWLDLLSEKSAARYTHQAEEKGVEARELHLETGHPLLTSNGRLGRDFLARTLEIPDAECDDNFIEPGEDNLLHCLQSDILHIRERGDKGNRLRLAVGDGSIQVHSCHGPMREIEVLHDQILDLFENLPGLEPRDILVMTPDIESYAPYVSAVFGGQEPDRRIPYGIADRSARGISPIADTFLRLLGMQEGRFSAPDVLDLLEVPAVRRRFGLDPGDLEKIRNWVSAVRIRWGRDADDRARNQLPAFGDNSWRAGLDRLMLGYALPGGGNRLFEGILPFDHVEGDEARILGALVEFTELLFTRIDALGEKRPLEQWAVDLRDLVSALFQPDEETEWEFAALGGVLDGLRTRQEASGFDEEVGLGVVRAWLRDQLDNSPMSAGFMTGGVTFSAMVPMRSIPFRVIALVGMNDGAFPRQSRPIGFDLMARNPAPGDPSRRNEDRYLFLEALLSARDILYLSYVGQSIQDNSESPPSVLICELLDTLSRGFLPPAGDDVLDHVVTRHRLQAFNSAYFSGQGGLFSYSAEDFRAVQASRKGRKAPSALVAGALPPMPEETTDIPVHELVAFLANPSRHFLTRRLEVRLGDMPASIEERESFSLEGLDRYELGQDLVRWRLEGREPSDCFDIVKARGLLPPGVPGRNAFQTLSSEVDRFVKRLDPLMAGGTPDSVVVDLELEDARLVGDIDGFRGDRLVRFRMARLLARDRLRAWVEHLVLCSAIRGPTHTTHVIGSDGESSFGVVKDSRDLLEGLVSLYREGFNRPIPFFPESSWEFATRSDGDAEYALRKARSRFIGSEYRRGESEDSWFRTCFRRTVPLDDEFMTVSRRILSPLIRAEGGADL